MSRGRVRRLPSDERRLYFEQAAARAGSSAQIIEKDFWVCWSLKRLFSLDEFRGHLTFKGGTTLSKVYRVIERFSEDVDVAIERDFLGFGGENDPEKGGSGKEQQRRIDRLKEACQAAVADRLQPQLGEAITTALGDDTDWSLSLDPDDPDRQSLLFQYPPAITGNPEPLFRHLGEDRVGGPVGSLPRGGRHRDALRVGTRFPTQFPMRTPTFGFSRRLGRSGRRRPFSTCCIISPRAERSARGCHDTTTTFTGCPKARCWSNALPTYITLKDVKKRRGHGQEDVFPVAQFERLWGDMTALSQVASQFVVVPRMRGQQLKEQAQLDSWLRDGSAAYVDRLCVWE